jgi:hypothetical protein
VSSFGVVCRSLLSASTVYLRGLNESCSRGTQARCGPPGGKGTRVMFALPLFYLSRYVIICRSQWPRGLRRGSAAARLLGLRVRIPPGARMSVCCECCVLSGRGLCDGLMTRPEESYRVWCVWVWSWRLEKWGGLGPQGAVELLEKKNYYFCSLLVLFLSHLLRLLSSLFSALHTSRMLCFSILFPSFLLSYLL